MTEQTDTSTSQAQGNDGSAALEPQIRQQIIRQLTLLGYRLRLNDTQLDVVTRLFNGLGN